MTELERRLNDSDMDPAEAQLVLNSMRCLKRYCSGRKCNTCPFIIEDLGITCRCIFDSLPALWDLYLKEDPDGT